MTATQLLVVPKSIPMTSPASLLLNRLPATSTAELKNGLLIDLPEISELVRRSPSWSAILTIVLLSVKSVLSNFSIQV